MARGLHAAAAIRADGRLAEFIRRRYRSWSEEPGRRLEAGALSLADCERLMRDAEEPRLESGRQELLEDLITRFI